MLFWGCFSPSKSAISPELLSSLFIKLLVVPFAPTNYALFLLPLSSSFAVSREWDGDFFAWSHYAKAPPGTWRRWLEHKLSSNPLPWSTLFARGNFGGWQPTSTRTFANHITYKLQLFSVLYRDPL